MWIYRTGQDSVKWTEHDKTVLGRHDRTEQWWVDRIRHDRAVLSYMTGQSSVG